MNQKAIVLTVSGLIVALVCGSCMRQGALNQPPKGFVALFNGEDLTGWKGLVGNPATRDKMSCEKLAEAQADADEVMRAHWKVVNGVLVFDGKGHSLCTAKDYGDFELLVNWKIEKHGDSGIYLRGSPQVQIWDRVKGAKGSGGLYNNKKGPSGPLKCADNPVGQWNTFRIIMTGERVTVYLNDALVVDNVVLENFWERDKSIYSVGQIELQSHNSPLYFKNIFIKEIPRGKPLFNGRDLTSWRRHDGLPGHGGVAGKWTVEDGAIVGVQDPPGKGGFLTTLQRFRDFELTLETKIDWPFDSGVFLRTGLDGKSHQVTLDYHSKGETGAIYCPWTRGFVHHCPDGVKYFKKGAWNHIRIICQGEPAKIRVWLNGTLITNFQHTTETTEGIPEEGTVCLQIHPGGEGFEESKARFRNILIREIPREEDIRGLTNQEKAEGFVSLFNSKDLAGWTGNTKGHIVEDGKIIVYPEGGSGNLYTEKEYSDFIFRFEFKLTPGANNGLGIRAPMPSHAAYDAMELQILDDTADKYKNLKPYQFHGSIYGVVPAKRGHLKSVGEWNFEEVIAKGRRITVNLNGITIVDANTDQASASGTMDGKDHPGLKRSKGHIAFLSHGDHVEFRNIRIKQLK